MQSCQLIGSNSTTIDVEGGTIHGQHGALLELSKESLFLGDFHFTTTMTGFGNIFPLIRNTDTFLFTEFNSVRLINWEVDIMANTVNKVNDGTLSLGRGGGLVDSNITLCFDCTLNFNSDMGHSFSSRTYHEFTSNSAISCPTCHVNFQTDGAWVRFAGIFDLDIHHIQNHGRLQFLDTARVSVTNWTLQNCDVHFLRAQVLHLIPGDVYEFSGNVLNRCGRLLIKESRYALEFVDLYINGGYLEIIDQRHTLNTSVTLIEGNGAFRIKNLFTPLVAEGFVLNGGYLDFDTGHTVSLNFINMTYPSWYSNIEFLCLPSIGYSGGTPGVFVNLSAIYSTDNFKISDLRWQGGTFAIGQLDVLGTLYSVTNLNKAFHGFGYLYIHSLAYLGGPGMFAITNSIHWYIYPDAIVNFISNVQRVRHSGYGPTEANIHNDGHVIVPNEGSVVRCSFKIHQRNLLTIAQDATIHFSAHSHSTGDYVFNTGSRLELGNSNHEFDSTVRTFGSGNIGVSWWMSSEGHRIFFNGRWEFSTLFAQSRGLWIFGPQAFLNFKDVELKDSVHVTIDRSRSASGDWNFDSFSASDDSVFDIIEPETPPKMLILSTDELVLYTSSSEAPDYTDIELYDGKVEFSTGNDLHFNSLIVDGGTLSGSDTIIVDSFVWRCGRIEGDSDGVSGTIHVQGYGFIQTCSSTLPSNPNPNQKQLLHDSILNFLGTSHLRIDTSNWVTLSDTSSINIRGTSTMRAAMFTGTDHRLNFIDSTVTTEGFFQRDLSVWVDFNQNSLLDHVGGSITFSNQLDFYGHFLVRENSHLLFNQASSSSRFEFYEVSRLSEIITEGPYKPPVGTFQPVHEEVNVVFRGQFEMTELSYSIGTVTFTGAIDLNIKRIRLDGTAILHFDALDNDLGPVRGFELDENSIMKFSTGQGLITFDGDGLLTGNAEIVGYGDDFLISSTADEGSFVWSGGGFSGEIVVDMYSDFEFVGNYDRRIRDGVTIILHDQMTWQSVGHLNGFGNSKIIVSETGNLRFVINGAFSCRTSSTTLIVDPCVCDSELIINGEIIIDSSVEIVSSCWGITVNGELNVNFGTVEAFSYLSGNGNFNVGSLGAIWFASNSKTSLIGPNSNFYANGQVSLFHDTVVYIQGSFNSNDDVFVRNGTLIFDDDAFLNHQFDLTVETGNAIFRDVDQMVPLGVVTCQNGDVTFNTHTIVNISTLNLIAGMVHGYDEVHLLKLLNWQGGGFGPSTNYFILDFGLCEDDFDENRVMLPGSRLVNRGHVIFRGLVSVYADQGTIVNELESQMQFLDLVFLYDTSIDNNSLFHNNGTVVSFSTELYNELYFANYGSTHVISGEIVLGSGGTFGPASSTFIGKDGKMSIISRLSYPLNEDFDYTLIENDSSSNVTGMESAIVINDGQLDLIEGHWMTRVNDSDSAALLFNHGDVSVFNEYILFQWSITQFNTGSFNLFLLNLNTWQLQNLLDSIISTLVQSLLLQENLYLTIVTLYLTQAN
ncbi:hypothetical protein GEMRC1_009220 [Eukaryota sp. GEM-RC1]